ncbi:MAG: MFS transporter, partial [Dehalococcoidia bacterium]|nr:MFS transporter [Dehalococcoidia bacterium]
MTPPAPPTEPRLRPWDALRFRDYRFLWGTGLLVVISLWMRILATSQWLFDETGSEAVLGLIGLVQLFVQIPALLWGGAVADHLDRKKVMLGAQMGTFGVLLALGIMSGAGVLEPWHVYTAIGI